MLVGPRQSVRLRFRAPSAIRPDFVQLDHCRHCPS